ncbi:MAG: hypothetical protein IMZ57_11025 [Acidobacteria bacterium]|nr:hypothetical protein [Acidobacteriota bacterium]
MRKKIIFTWDAKSERYVADGFTLEINRAKNMPYCMTLRDEAGHESDAKIICVAIGGPRPGEYV